MIYGGSIFIVFFQVKEYDVKEVNKCSFDEILISPRMLADHMPNYLDEVTQKMITMHSLFPTFRFSDPQAQLPPLHLWGFS